MWQEAKLALTGLDLIMFGTFLIGGLFALKIIAGAICVLLGIGFCVASYSP